MKGWKSILVIPNTSIKEALKIIDSFPPKIALVVDKNKRLLGTVTDGDVRRAMLKNISLEESVQNVMNTNPITASIKASKMDIAKIIQGKKLRQIPILDEGGHVIDLRTADNMLEPKEHNNLVVLMAGGMGTRLKPLTSAYPKSLLRVGGKPILESIIENFKEYGFHRFYISVNYKSKMIEDYFRDGSKWNVQIHYLKEKEQLGTAGALSLLPERPVEPLLVMNGDLLTKVNFHHILDFHYDNESQATMAIGEYDFQVPYGVVKLNENEFVGLDEKPVKRFFINAGIYILEPEVLDIIPKKKFINMTDVFKLLIKKGFKTTTFPIREYWIDIGQISDLDQANGDYKKIFK